MSEKAGLTSKPKFGEWLRGIYASESNPQRDGMYVRTIRRTGRMNPGTFYEMTDGNGRFWQYPAQSVERVEAPQPPAEAQPVAWIMQDKDSGEFWPESFVLGSEPTEDEPDDAEWVPLFLRPPPSAPFGECGCGKPADYFDVMGRPSCNKRIRCAEQQQASAPVGDSLVQTALRNLPQYISKSGLVGPDKHSAMQCFEVLRDILAQQPAAVDEMGELVGLLDEVRSHFTRDDDLPDDLLPRIDAALAAQQGGAK